MIFQDFATIGVPHLGWYFLAAGQMPVPVYLYWTRRPSRSYAKAGMNRPAGVKTAHSCGHTSS